MSDIAIIVKDLKAKLQGQTVLDAISFTLRPQQHLAIVGESGSGKTTLAKAIAGLVFHEGTVTIQTADTDYNKNVLFVAQQDTFKNLSNQSSFYYQQRFNSTESEDAATVMQNLTETAVKAIPDRIRRTAKIEALLTRLNMQHRSYTPLIQLSNGEHKRLQLIRALLFQPKVLLLDQPFIGLDVQTRKELHTLINDIATHTTIILITNSNEIPDCITHIAQLHKGILKSYTEVKDFKEDIAAQNSFIASKPLPQLKEQTDFNNAVLLKNVSVQYGDKTILQNINWQVRRSDKWWIQGPNGAGKSTLLSLLNGDNPQAYANEIYLFDKRRGTSESIWDIKKKIGYISPELHWFFDKGITVYGAIASGFFDTMGLYRKISAAQEKIVAQWIAYFDLNTLQHKSLSLLPSGLQRLVLLARALVKSPPMLILDEPCQGLDDNQTATFVNLIDELVARNNRTLLYVTHYEQEVPNCIDKKLVLNKGVATFSNIIKRKNEAA